VDVTLEGWTLGLEFGALVPVGEPADHVEPGFKFQGNFWMITLAVWVGPQERGAGASGPRQTTYSSSATPGYFSERAW
jgi:hypothetical protein